MNTPVKRLTGFGAGVLLWAGTSAAAYAGGEVDTTFHLENFSKDNSADITNQYWPMPEGTTFVYRSIGKRGNCEVNPVQVAHETKMIDGVATRPVLDRVYEDYNCTGSSDFLSEQTTDWYAQDITGNIWYFGEATQTYCPGPKGPMYDPTCVPSTEGSWKAGENGAAPGIVMLADPSPGDFYRQEYADAAHDMAKVLRWDANVSLTFPNQLDTSDYTGCMVTKEWSPLEHGAIENKYYCLGTGFVLDNEFQSGTVRTELVNITHQ